MLVSVFSLVLALVLTGVQAQCPAGTTPSPTTSSDCNSDPSGSGYEGGKCQTVKVIDRNIINDFCEQPIYYTFMPNNTKYRQYDNICVTMFNLKDNPNKLIYYYSIKFINGSSSFETYIVSAKAPGINRYAGLDDLFTEYIIGEDSCGSYVTYSCGDSEEGNEPYVYGTTTNCSSLPLGEDCLQSAKDVIRAAGLPVGEYFALPNKLSKVCQTRHQCLPPSNPLFGEQGGSCATYEGSDCQCQK